jgi:hypothetical protein
MIDLAVSQAPFAGGGRSCRAGDVDARGGVDFSRDRTTRCTFRRLFLLAIRTALQQACARISVQIVPPIESTMTSAVRIAARAVERVRSRSVRVLAPLMPRFATAAARNACGETQRQRRGIRRRVHRPLRVQQVTSRRCEGSIVQAAARSNDPAQLSAIVGDDRGCPDHNRRHGRKARGVIVWIRRTASGLLVEAQARRARA